MHRFSDAQTGIIDPLAENERERRLRILTHILYGLYAAFWVTGGVSVLVAIIINYVKREETVGTLYATHFTWQIRTFWWAVAGCIVSGLLAVFLVGFAIFLAVAVWILYRVVKGWLYLFDGKPMLSRAAL